MKHVYNMCIYDMVQYTLYIIIIVVGDYIQMANDWTLLTNTLPATTCTIYETLHRWIFTRLYIRINDYNIS